MKQLTLVDESGSEGVRGEVRAAHGEIFGRGGLQVSDCVGVEVALEPRLGGRHLLQGRGIDDLVRGLPDLGEVAPELRLRGQGRVGLPDGHRFVQTAAVEKGAAGAHEVGDEREDLVGGCGPVEIAVGVFDVAVEGDVRDVDQLGHVAAPVSSGRSGCSGRVSPSNSGGRSARSAPRAPVVDGHRFSNASRCIRHAGPRLRPHMHAAPKAAYHLSAMPDEKSMSDDAEVVADEQMSAEDKDAFRTELLRRPGALEEFRQAVRDEYSAEGRTPPISRLAVAGAMAGGGDGRFRFAVRRNQYETEQMRIVLASTLRSNSNAIDIGAASGEVLREIQRVAPNGRHIAFEPLPNTARRLANAFPGVDVRAMALSDTNGTANFVCVKNSLAYSGLERYTYPEYVDASEIEEITVDVGRLDDNLSAEYAPALIKIDVQGAEGLLLQGALRTLATYRPVIIFEHIFKTAAVYGTTSISLHRLLCAELGYGIFDLAGDGPYSVEEFEESQMQLRWINYLACPR